MWFSRYPGELNHKFMFKVSVELLEEFFTYVKPQEIEFNINLLIEYRCLLKKD